MTRTRKILTIIIPVAALFLLTGCPEDTGIQEREQEERFFELYLSSRYPAETPRPSGLYFIRFSEGSGGSPVAEDWVLVNYTATRIPEDVIFETTLENVARDNKIDIPGALYGPYKVQNNNLVKGVTEGLQLMKEGGKAIMFFRSDLGYGSEGFGLVDPYQSLKYEVELLEVIGDIEPYEKQRLLAYVDTIPWTDTIHDPATDATLYYVTYEAGEGDTIVDGSTVEAIYTGTLIDGRVFDENLDPANPFKFEVGATGTIDGWNLVMPGLQDGWKGKLIVPYQLAYGENENFVTKPNTRLRFRSMPPYENLVFEIQVVDVTAPKADSAD